MSACLEFRLADTFGAAYPAESDLWIERFTGRVRPELEASLGLSPGRPGLQHLRVACDGQPPGSAEHGIIRARFARNDQPQSRAFEVMPVFETGAGAAFQITIALYPSGFYAANGLLGQPDAFLLTTRPLLPRRPVQPFASEALPLTASERAFARDRWGSLLAGVAQDYERAQILSRSLAGDLQAHSGIPSDEMMRAPPFRQYEMMLAGQGQGYCENWAVIFVHACRALNIQARTIWLAEQVCETPGLIVQMGSCHLTTEIFDAGLNQWIWIDNRFSALGAYLGEEGPLSLAEFCLFLNQPQRRARLRLAVHRPDEPVARRLPLDQCPKQDFDCFEGWQRSLRYGMRPAPDPRS